MSVEGDWEDDWGSRNLRYTARQSSPYAGRAQDLRLRRRHGPSPRSPTGAADDPCHMWLLENHGLPLVSGGWSSSTHSPRLDGSASTTPSRCLNHPRLCHPPLGPPQIMTDARQWKASHPSPGP